MDDIRNTKVRQDRRLYRRIGVAEKVYEGHHGVERWLIETSKDCEPVIDRNLDGRLGLRSSGKERMGPCPKSRAK